MKNYKLFFLSALVALSGCAGPKAKDLRTPDSVYQINLKGDIDYIHHQGLMKIEYTYTLKSGAYVGSLLGKNGTYYQCEGRCVEILCPEVPFNNGSFEGGLWVSNEEPKTYRFYTVINDDKEIGSEQGMLVRGLVLLDVDRLSKGPKISDESIVESLSVALKNKILKAN